MCVAFIAVFGFAMIFFVARVDGGVRVHHSLTNTVKPSP